MANGGTGPPFTTTDAQGIVSRLYGVEGDVSALPGNYDQNFVVTSVDGPLFVLKVARFGEREDVLDLQHRAHANVWPPAMSVSTCPASSRPAIAR